MSCSCDPHSASRCGDCKSAPPRYTPIRAGGDIIRAGGEMPDDVFRAGASNDHDGKCPGWAQGVSDLVRDNRSVVEGCMVVIEFVGQYFPPFIATRIGLQTLIDKCDAKKGFRHTMAKSARAASISGVVFGLAATASGLVPGGQPAAPICAAASALELALSPIFFALSKGHAPKLSDYGNLASALIAAGAAFGGSGGPSASKLSALDAVFSSDELKDKTKKKGGKVASKFHSKAKKSNDGGGGMAKSSAAKASLKAAKRAARDARKAAARAHLDEKKAARIDATRLRRMGNGAAGDDDSGDEGGGGALKVAGAAILAKLLFF